MTSNRFKKAASIAVAALLLVLLCAALVIQFAGGKGPVPTWLQLRAFFGVPLQTE